MPDPHRVAFLIDRPTLEPLIANQVSEVQRKLKPGVRYERTETMTAAGMLIEWVEIAQPEPVPPKTVPKLTASKW